jgi:hypothetical protein
MAREQRKPPLQHRCKKSRHHGLDPTCTVGAVEAAAGGSRGAKTCLPASINHVSGPSVVFDRAASPATTLLCQRCFASGQTAGRHRRHLGSRAALELLHNSRVWASAATRFERDLPWAAEAADRLALPRPITRRVIVLLR